MQVFTVFDLGNYKVYGVLPQYKRVLRDHSKVSYHLVHYALRIAPYRNRVAQDEEKNNFTRFRLSSNLQWSCKAQQGSVFCSYPGFVYFDLHLITMCKKYEPFCIVSSSKQNCLILNFLVLLCCWWGTTSTLIHTVHIKFNIDWHLELRDKCYL